MTPQNNAAIPGKLALQEARLGSRALGARLVFRIPPAEGFMVQAMLECETHPHPVASWQSEEIAGKDTHEILEAPGMYVLHVSIIYTSVEPIRVTLGFKLAGHGSTTQVLEFSGKRGDVNRAMAFAGII